LPPPPPPPPPHPPWFPPPPPPQDLVRMCNTTGMKCNTPVKGPYDPHDSIEQRIKRAADLATQTFNHP
jgi:hypothetical protein